MTVAATYDKQGNPRCGACVYFKTARCLYANFSDVIQGSDAACCCFFPVVERLRLLKRSVRSAEKFAKKVEDI